MFGTEDIVANIRLFAVHGNESFGYLSLSYVLNQALLLMGLWRYPRIPLWKLLTIYCMTFMNAFAIMEKGMLFFIIIITLFVLYEKRRLRMRSVVLSLGVIVLLFFAFNLSRATEGSEYAEETTLLDFVVMYVLSPPVAFGTISQDISLQPGSHTFQAIYKLLAKWGVGDFVINERVQDFVFVPISTNIYTIFQPFFEDFKYRGIAFFALIYGIFSGWMYRLYQNGNAVGKIIYTYFVYLLVLQFYQENLFLNIVQFSQLVFIVLLVHQQFIGINFNNKRASPLRQQPGKNESCLCLE
jgi:oligosaccharide repeat unit polymerase